MVNKTSCYRIQIYSGAVCGCFEIVEHILLNDIIYIFKGECDGATREITSQRTFVII